jgi:hypothetical protein
MTSISIVAGRRRHGKERTMTPDLCFDCIRHLGKCGQAREENGNRLCGEDTCAFLIPKDGKIHCRKCKGGRDK